MTYLVPPSFFSYKKVRIFLDTIESHRGVGAWYWNVLCFLKDGIWYVGTLSFVSFPYAYIESLCVGFLKRKVFKSIKTCCIFIGYPRSGHSLIGSLLDAHPNVVVSHELNLLNLVRMGFTRQQLCASILNSSCDAALRGRPGGGGYFYAVPGQWQGAFKQITVVGDKRGQGTVEVLRRRPHILKKFLSRWGNIDVKFVHVIRNPFDNIATISMRHELSLAEAVLFYFTLAETCEKIRSHKETTVIDVYHEAFLENPSHELQRLCEYLGVAANSDYLDSCASIVWKVPHQTRHDVTWTPELITSVLERCRRFSFLAHYRYD